MVFAARRSQVNLMKKNLPRNTTHPFRPMNTSKFSEPYFSTQLTMRHPPQHLVPSLFYRKHCSLEKMGKYVLRLKTFFVILTDCRMFEQGECQTRWRGGQMSRSQVNAPYAGHSFKSYKLLVISRALACKSRSDLFCHNGMCLWVCMFACRQKVIFV